MNSEDDNSLLCLKNLRDIRNEFDNLLVILNDFLYLQKTANQIYQKIDNWEYQEREKKWNHTLGLIQHNFMTNLN